MSQGRNIVDSLSRRKTMNARFEKCQKPMGDDNGLVDSCKIFIKLLEY